MIAGEFDEVTIEDELGEAVIKEPPTTMRKLQEDTKGQREEILVLL